MTPWILLGVAGWLVAAYLFYLNQKAVKNVDDVLEYLRKMGARGRDKDEDKDSPR